MVMTGLRVEGFIVNSLATAKMLTLATSKRASYGLSAFPIGVKSNC
jgi:hypothetical protein